jgi:hypothetical protein
MKSKALMAMAVAGTFACSSAFAWQLGNIPSSAPEVPMSMSTMTSLDWRTGGYKGWGPMANPATPHNVSESNPTAFFEREAERAQHLAEVHQANEQVWVANAPLRADYEVAVGATPGAPAGGILFFGGTAPGH